MCLNHPEQVHKHPAHLAISVTEEERHELADPPQTPGAAYIAAPLPTTKNEQVELCYQ